ncbi:MAG: SAM-dependent methyltransferase [Bacilli bacterium]|nr:SAM-dependent methyltransferase [Bacilli bacterium]
MVVLSKRLAKIAEKVLRGSRLADIGSDHALLPVFLAQQGVIVSGIAGELNKGPFAAATKQVAEAGLKQTIQVRQGNGLEVIEPSEVDIVSIAGMGGQLIVQILTEGLAKLDGVSQLILQPNVGEECVRRWLVEHDWFLREEHILEEDGKTYEILLAERTNQANLLNQALYRERLVGDREITRKRFFAMGPYLLEQAEPIWVRKWEDELRNLQRICDQLSNSQLPASISRQKEIKQEIAEIKGVLECLQKAKP